MNSIAEILENHQHLLNEGKSPSTIASYTTDV
jgi:hypothetical protein